MPDRAVCTMMLPERIAKSVISLAFGLLIAWCCGFASFLHTASRASPDPPHADGIAVLTGGADRVPRALRLLADGHARLLLITGVPGQVDLAQIMRPIIRPLGGHAQSFAARITLGREATSTWSNGMEIAAWAEQHNMQSLIVVTAAYHMPRALLEIRRRLPGVRLYPSAVLPVPRDGTNDSNTLGQLAAEYTKFLASSAGLGFLSRRPPIAVGLDGR
jgi:uncharacterized SAM-binding protein YcdF (DUF218 family)